MPRVIKDDIDRFMIYGILHTTRTIYLGEISATDDDVESPGVDYRLADRIIKSIHVLESVSTEPINIIVNNPGGDEYHGLAIYDAIRATVCRVTVRIMGHAMSMAAWFVQAADHRIIYPNATLMLHYGDYGYYGHSKDFDVWAKENKRINALMEKHFLERIVEKNPRYTLKELRALLRFDTLLTANDAFVLGLVDEIIQFPERG